MNETEDPRTPGQADLANECKRLNTIIQSLMDRAERSAGIKASDFSTFQTTVTLEQLVRQRTTDLEAALRENEKVNRALNESEQRFRGVVDQSLVGFVLTAQGRITYCNARFADIFGYTEGEILAMDPRDLATRDDRGIVAEEWDERQRGDIDKVEYAFQGRRKDGTVVDIECHGSAMRDGDQTVLISAILDVTDRMRAERQVRVLQQQLLEQSTHDPLTGLHNRRSLDEFLVREIVRGERDGKPLSVIMGDLDHFKAVNDTYGHPAGDEVLRAFAALLQRRSRESDFCCRYGGEEFLIILPGLPESGAVERAEELRSEMATQQVPWGVERIDVTVSFGVAAYPRDGRTPDDLLAAVDAALYVAKSAGRNRVSMGGDRRVVTRRETPGATDQSRTPSDPQ